jgi:hypothetical protein
VSAADTVSEYDTWVDQLLDEKPKQHHKEVAYSAVTDHLFRPELKGYKRPVILVYHVDAAERDEFIDKWHIVVVKPVNARDRQMDMVWKDEQAKQAAAWDQEVAQAQAEGREVTGATLEEIHGLTENDPWDKRSPEMKEQDKALRDQMKDMQKKGNISGDDSFGDANTQRGKKPTESGVVVTDVRGKQRADGKVEIDSVIAHKPGSGITEPTEDSKPKKRYSFTPEDFAAVLAGDGSADHLNIPAAKDADKRRREPGSKDLQLSSGAEEARREYQAKQKRENDEREAQRRLEEEQSDQEDHAKGIFHGCDLWPDQSIARADLPETVRQLLDRAAITGDQLPLKLYPLSSQLGNNVLLPGDSLGEERPLYVAATDNLTVHGVIQIGNPRVMIASKDDLTRPAWAVYAQRQVKTTEDGNEQFDVAIIKIR